MIYAFLPSFLLFESDPRDFEQLKDQKESVGSFPKTIFEIFKIENLDQIWFHQKFISIISKIK
jgi:hypothetical protein